MSMVSSRSSSLAAAAPLVPGLKKRLWRRAGRHFAAAGRPHESADAFLAAGDRKTAAAILETAGEAARLARLQLESGDFTAAVRNARKWLRELAAEPDRQSREETEARLCLAAALIRSGEPAPARPHYLSARKRLRLNPAPDPARRGADWEALGRFGTLVSRPDLVRLGYEKALAAYGRTFNLKRLDCARRYREAVADDAALVRDLDERIAAWQPRSALRRERDKLFAAMREWSDG